MNKVNISIRTLALFGLMVLSLSAQASDLTIPNQFTSGARAVAADVNANFDATAVSVNDNQTQLTDLIAQITALTETVNANSTTIVSLETENTNLQAEVDSLQADIVAGLSGVLTVGTDNQGNTAAIFSGVNLHVNNGAEDTEIINGLGNFIIGYDEKTTNNLETCADGSYSDQTSCEDNSEIWAISHKSGSHNLIVGRAHNYSKWGGMVAGNQNNISAPYASVLGGLLNTASGYYSTVSGGDVNTASATLSSIIGGFNNTANGLESSISGGFSNTATGSWSSVSGGQSNTAIGNFSNVSGGDNRTANGRNDWVAGSLFEDN